MAIVLAASLLSGCSQKVKDYAYRDLESARAAMKEDRHEDDTGYAQPDTAEAKAMRKRMKDERQLWPYDGVDLAVKIPALMVQPADKKEKAAPAPWPLRLAVVTYDHNPEYCNPFSGGEECLFLENNFERLVPVLAAHGLYWDLRRTNRFSAVHYQPDSLADYDVVFHVGQQVEDRSHRLVVRWSGEISGEADSKVASVKKESFSDQVAHDPEGGYEDVCSATSSVARKISLALGTWLRANTPEQIQHARARHDINYFHYFDEHFSELNTLLEAAQTPEERAEAQEEIEKRRLVLATAQSIERQMCANASLGKRDYVLTQLQAKEEIDIELVAYNLDIEKEDKQRRRAKAGIYVASIMGGISQGMNEAAYEETGDPYYAYQAEQTRLQTQQITEHLGEVAEAARKRADEIRVNRDAFAAQVVPELETTFKDSPYADFLKEFFDKVDFSSVQRMRLTTREAYLRTFAWEEPAVEQ